MEHYHIHSREDDIDVEDFLDAEEFDDRIARMIHPLALAFERSEDLSSSFRHLMSDMLRQFLGTHQSIRLLIKSREENPSGLADAMSLAREQVEKVYAVALLLEDPDGWTERYLKDSWRKSYERHLIDAHERHALSRYAESLEQHSKALHQERTRLGITDQEEEFVEWSFENIPGASGKGRQTPKHLKNAAKSIATFPTPGATIKKVSSDSLKAALVRLYREYSYLCDYSHSGFSKLLPGYMEGHMNLTPAEKQKVIDTEYAQSIMLSYLSAGIACAEGATRDLLRGRTGSSGPPKSVADPDLLVKLSNTWDTLEESSLIGRSLYKMRVRKILPYLLGG